MRRPAFKRLIVLAALVSILAGSGFFFVPDADAFGCNSYSNSSINFFWDWGWACSYTGPGCQECVLAGPSGYSVCLESGSRRVCYDYQS